MSALRNTAVRALRTPVVARPFSTTPAVLKVVPDAIKQAAEVADRKAADAALKGIETGEKITDAAKQATGQVAGNAAQAANQAQAKGSEMANEAQGKAKEYAGEAKAAANEYTGEAKGKASELAGEAKGKAHEMAGKAKGAKEEVKNTTAFGTGSEKGGKAFSPSQ